MNMNKIKDYCASFNKSTKLSSKDKMKFINMLQNKIYFTKRTNQKVYAYDGLKTSEELEKMMVLAEMI